MSTANTKQPEGAQVRSEKARDVRHNNIVAAKAVADVVRTSLGPRGMDKMVSIIIRHISLLKFLVLQICAKE